MPANWASVGELEGEVRALKAGVSRLQNAGKTVIAQREEWKARALVAEQKAVDLTAQLANRRLRATIGSTRCGG